MAGTLSEARRIANRLNSLKSTGPKTEAGKARSRANAVKHGLTGAGVALPGEDAAAVAARFSTIQEDLAPQTTLGIFLAHQMALMTVRCQRAARHETALLTERVHQALAQFAQARREQAHQLLIGLAQHPEANLALLRAIPEGVDLLIAGLRELLAVVVSPTLVWDQASEQKLARYLGSRAPIAAIFDPATRPAASTDAEWNAQVTAALVSLIGAEVARLHTHRATFDPAAIEFERARVIDRALFDPGKEGTLARKYEAAARRDLHRALCDFEVVEATVAEPEVEAAGVDARIAPAPAVVASPVAPTRITPAAPGADSDRNPLPANDLDQALASFESLPGPDLPFAIGRPPASGAPSHRPLQRGRRGGRHPVG